MLPLKMEALAIGRHLTSGTLSLLTPNEKVFETNKQVSSSALYI